ncbi:MAG: hypothetical protein GTN53_22865 [Candidatus Aminicenantes bacterium]|nr:hypothetical protein [Candidatus Aminicenantes bacterium]NIQ69347.1 hypothetical protein [Candidatus Aminicenantes bacterium]NIT25347.1 hypothetical protein [Candidatus Aminicenantes bacterium]
MKNYFKKKEFLKWPARPSRRQVFLLNYFWNNLNIIRAELKAPIIITSFNRSIQKYRSMKARGLYPSPTSDHFWGQAVPCQLDKHKKIYGPYFTESAGAADIVTPTISVFYAFRLIVKMAVTGVVNLGQVIYEKRRHPTPAEWIHLSNPRDHIFNKTYLEKTGGLKRKFLTSKNGGKTYRVFSF